MAKGERSVNPFRDDDDIRQDMYEDQERRYEEEMDRRDKVRKKTRKKLSDKEGLKRQRALRSLVGKASNIQKLNKSDISKVSSFAKKAAGDYKAPEMKSMVKDLVKATPATRGLLSAVARGAGLIGAAATMNEFRKVHKEIKKKGSGSYGSKSLMEILK